MTFATSLPYSAAERRADDMAAQKRITRAKLRILACPSGQRYDAPFDPAAHRRLLRRLGERE